MHFLYKAACGLVILTGLGLTATPVAHAQHLVLGQSGSTTLSATATITDVGTTASGTYYYDGAYGVVFANQNQYAELDAYGPSVASVSVGSFLNLFTLGTSTANISGGMFTSQVGTDGTSTANISGGIIDTLYTYDTSTANVEGGTIIRNIVGLGSSTTNVTGGRLGSLATEDASTIDLFGSGFTETFRFTGSGLRGICR